LRSDYSIFIQHVITGLSHSFMKTLVLMVTAANVC